MKFKKLLVVGIAKDSIDAPYWAEINSLAEKVVSIPKDSGDLKKELADADGLLVNFGIEITKDHIDAAPNLKYIGIMATAFNKVDVAYAKGKGILVCNLAGYSTESVAEFTIAALLEHLRGLREGRARGLAGNFSEMGIEANEIKSKIFAVLGLGSIGGRVAEIAQGFGADVRYSNRTRKKDFEKRGIKYQDVDSLIKEADFISLNLALVPETTGTLNKKRFESLKAGVVIINTAPMELVDIEALKARLAKGDIIFILDHSDEMKKEDVTSLTVFKNCIVYPPIAYISDEARTNKQRILVNNIKNFLEGNPSNKVN